jgi:ribosomal protein S27AE
MTCPACGAEMNHHAEKLVYSTGPDQASSADPHLGGVIEELHTCPRCGTSVSRPAPRGAR